MIVKVKYFKPELNAYAGGEYTYRTDLLLEENMRVIAPTYKGEQKAIVTQAEIPMFQVSPELRAKLRDIEKLDMEA